MTVEDFLYSLAVILPGLDIQQVLDDGDSGFAWGGRGVDDGCSE